MEAWKIDYGPYWYLVDGQWWRNGCRSDGPAPADYIEVSPGSWRSPKWCEKHRPELVERTS
jgi:hypothetical protein